LTNEGGRFSTASKFSVNSLTDDSMSSISHTLLNLTDEDGAPRTPTTNHPPSNTVEDTTTKSPPPGTIDSLSSKLVAQNSELTSDASSPDKVGVAEGGLAVAEMKHVQPMDGKS
jgi:hypothetical protein